MSSPCWSLPHLLSSSLQHEAHLDSTTFSKTTLYTENLFHKLHGRKATLKNHSHTSLVRAAETCAQTLPQNEKPTIQLANWSPAGSKCEVALHQVAGKAEQFLAYFVSDQTATGKTKVRDLIFQPNQTRLFS